MKRSKRIFPTLLFLLSASALFLSGCTAPASPAALPSATPGAQRLRITNQSPVPLHHLVVIFPDERVAFGDLPAGATSTYQPFPQGVYRYAAYSVEIEGQKYEQAVVDWIGEAPLPGEDFTYILEADPSRRESGEQVIRLLQVDTDQPPSAAGAASTSTPEPLETETASPAATATGD